VDGFGDCRDDEALTGAELEIVAAWVGGGAPEGGPALLPPTPDFTKAPPLAPGGVSLQLPAGTVLEARNLRPGPEGAISCQY
jgi:hypothetical protein